MLRYLIILFLMLPFIDFYVLIKFVEVVGLLETVVFSIGTGVIGASLIRREGRYVIGKLQRSVTGEEVTRNFVGGAILVLSGLMLLSPGFVTDVLGAVMAFRPVRERLVVKITKDYSSNMQVEFEVF